MKYEDFVASKARKVPTFGHEPADVHPMLFDFQAMIVKWAIRRGRAAIFADCGLGKTLCQLEWARQSGDRVLIVAPLAVAEQTIAEGAKVSLDVRKVDRPDDVPGIQITNYQKLHHFVGAPYDAIVLDESGILKSLDGRTRTMLLTEFANIPRRLCCTATPAPNDLSELCNHAQFLGVMSRVEMLATFFVHDSERSGADGWRLKGHAVDEFWRWVAKWAVYVRKPSDLGFPDEGFALPDLTIRQEIVNADWKPEGMLFNAGLGGINDRRDARRNTMDARIAKSAAIIKSSDEQWLVWCGLNAEGDGIEDALGDPGCVQVAGCDCDDKKVDAILWFTGKKCVCNEQWFNYEKRACGSLNTKKTGAEEYETTLSTQQRSKAGYPVRRKKTKSTCVSTIETTKIDGHGEQGNSGTNTMQLGENDIQAIQSIATSARSSSKSTSTTTRPSDSINGLGNTESQEKNIWPCCETKQGHVQYAERLKPTTGSTDCTLTTAIQPGSSEDCSVEVATSASENSTTTQSDLNERPCICGHKSGRRVLISKASMYGFGVNAQSCHNVLYLGIGDSYEQFYQSVRRCWRFGQKSPVEAVIVVSDAEQDVANNVRRKELDAAELAERIVEHAREAMTSEVRGAESVKRAYAPMKRMKLPEWAQKAKAVA